ncbi:ABC transporter B family member 21 [Panicum miliaceum]|uniref:ABC transporter B family member 21 n=1 Tax=Panicum miliaceum TaxID=4540 RepID=A0A3L6T2Q6_PANMI|nr:ABC transporter B family member 21 [Panicum miliaceum]
MSESSRAFQLDAPSSSAVGAGAGRGGKAGPSGAGVSVPFFRLFAFADGADAALMSLGALGAVANGAALPLMTVLFGRLIDAFGGAAATRDVVGRVSGVSLEFVYLAVASAAASFAAYAEAAVVVEQTIGSIRTVASFTGEKRAVEKYSKSLKRAYSSGVREGLAAGVGMGIVMVLLFCGYSLGIWYGAKLILEKGYTGAQVMNVIFAVLTGSLGQNYALQTKEMVKRLAIVLSKTRDIPSILKGITRHMSNSVSFLPTRVPTKYLQGKIGLDFYKRHSIKATIKDIFNQKGQKIIKKNKQQKCSHHELVRDPEGAYSQLICLQEASHASEGANYQNKSIRKGDSGICAGKQTPTNQSATIRSPQNNSRNHSLSVSFSVPLEIDVQDRSSKNVDEEIEKEVTLSRLASLNKPEIPVLILGSIASAVSGVIFPIFAILLSNVLKAFYEPPRVLRKDAEFWSSMFLVFGAVYFLSLPLGSYLFSVAGCKLIRRIRLMTFEKVVNMEIEWFDYPENSSGAIGARLSADAAKVRGLVGDALQLAVQNSATLVAGLVIAFISNWELSLIILALIPLIGLNGWIQMKFIQGFSADAKLMYEEASQVANDAVSSIRTVASFSAEEKLTDLYKKKCKGPLRAGIRTGIINGIGFGVSIFLLFGVYAASFYAGARLVEDGKTTFPKVFMVFLALSMAAIGVSHTSTLTSDSSKAKSAISSIFTIIDRKSRIDPSDDAGVTLEPLSGDIEFQHVRFRYPTRPDVQIFQDLCLTIQSGKGRHDTLVNVEGGAYASLVALHSAAPS